MNLQWRLAARLTVLLTIAAIVAGCGSQPAKKAGQASETAPATSATPAAASSKTIDIGWIGGLTGPLASIVLDSKAGSDQAVAEINASGGVLGRQLNLIYVDTQMDPQLSRQAVQRLVGSDKVSAIIGDYYSPNVAASAPLAEAAKVPMLSPAAAQPDLTAKGWQYFFRNCLSQDESVRTVADYAVHQLNIKSFVVLAGTDSFSKANADAFVAYAQKQGVQIAGVESYDRANTKDFSNLLLKYQGKNVGGIFLTGAQADGGLIAKQARSLGINAALVGTNSQSKAAYWSIAGSAAEGTVVSSEWAGEAANFEAFVEPNTAAFVNAWKSRTAKLPSFDNAHGYDAVKLLAQAITTAGSTDGPKIAAALRAIKQYKGAVGTYQFQSNGDATLPSYIIRWESPGKMVILGKAAS